MAKHRLLWRAGRATPEVVAKGASTRNTLGGKVIAQRMATEAEERQIARGEWVRSRPPGHPRKETSVRSSNQVRKAKNRPTGDALTIADGRLATLYVRRDVFNAAEIRAHYAQQGVQDLLAADDMHVTVIYSRQPVDWFAVGASWETSIYLPEGGPRQHEAFGPDRSALVLKFVSWDLAHRNEMARHHGATWDWPEYQPHITLSYAASGVDPDAIKPWVGKIDLGPEHFEQVDDNRSNEGGDG